MDLKLEKIPPSQDKYSFPASIIPEMLVKSVSCPFKLAVKLIYVNSINPIKKKANNLCFNLLNSIINQIATTRIATTKNVTPNAMID